MKQDQSPSRKHGLEQVMMLEAKLQGRSKVHAVDRAGDKDISNAGQTGTGDTGLTFNEVLGHGERRSVGEGHREGEKSQRQPISQHRLGSLLLMAKLLFITDSQTY